MTLRRLALVATAGALAVSGCGGGDEDEAQSAALDWANALADEDYTRSCELQGDTDDNICEGAAKQYSTSFDIEFPEAGEVRLSGDSGEVQITTSGGSLAVEVKKADGEWTVTNAEARGG